MELSRQMYFEDWLPVLLKKEESVGIEMGKGICMALSKISPAFKYNPIMRYGSKFLKLDTEDFKLQTLREKFQYYHLHVVFKYYTKSTIICRLYARIMERRLNRIVRKRNTYEKMLIEKHSQYRYVKEEPKCPFNFEYKDIFQSMDSN